MSVHSFPPARRWRAGVSVAAAAAMCLVSAPAFADTVSNDLDNTVDAAAELMPLTVGGASGTTDLVVSAKQGDGVNGCNLKNTGAITVSVQTSDASVATVSPTSVTFDDCDAPATVTVTPVGDGTATVSLAQTANNTGGTFDYAPATFGVSVTTPVAQNTAPTISVDGVDMGGSYAKGSVPAATCNVTDAEDGPSSFAAALSDVSGPYASDGIGSQTASCSYTDAGNLTASASETYSIVDLTAPAISYTLDPDPADGAHGWYQGDVTLTWHVGDSESPNSLATTGCANQSITEDQAATTYECSATSAGGSTGPVQVTIKRDGGKPTITHALSGGAVNAAGWAKDDVTVTFTCSDATSGVDNCIAGSGPGDAQTFGEGANQSVTGTATDNAGNTETDAVTGINVDKTGPSIGHSLSAIPNGNGWFKDDVTVTFVCDDALSGVASCLADGESGSSKVLGEGENQSVDGTATDVAGNTSTDSATDIDIDKTAPAVALAGGPGNGASYYWGSVPAAPTCDASDALSGLQGCTVSGYSSAVGTHTVTATATDRAGNESMASATYTVNAWTLKGFYQPVDMGGVLNTVKGGSTVPMKFEIFAGSELTDVASIKSFTTQKVACGSGVSEDAVETIVSTGGTSLRYDSTGGQFIQNWKTPTGAGTCYRATMTTQDGSSISALFKIK